MKRMHSVEGVRIHRRKNEAYIGDKQFKFGSAIWIAKRDSKYEVSERAHTDIRNSFRTSPMYERAFSAFVEHFQTPMPACSVKASLVLEAHSLCECANL